MVVTVQVVVPPFPHSLIENQGGGRHTGVRAGTGHHIRVEGLWVFVDFSGFHNPPLGVVFFSFANPCTIPINHMVHFAYMVSNP